MSFCGADNEVAGAALLTGMVASRKFKEESVGDQRHPRCSGVMSV